MTGNNNRNTVSFIVIGKNEGEHLPSCFAAIEAIKREWNDVIIETIYVDSKSTDNSVYLASENPTVDTVIELRGTVNAAIARNTGAERAMGAILCFIDGDMVVNKRLIMVVRSVIQGTNLFASGRVIDVSVSAERQPEQHEPEVHKLKDTREARTGGLFVIDSALWKSIGGMRTIFKRSQDLDLALRLSKAGHLLLRYREIVAHHYTVPYDDNNRFLEDLIAGNFLYHGLLVRKNFLNGFTHREYLKSYTSAALLLILAAISVVRGEWNLLFVYPLLVVLRVLVRKAYPGIFLRTALQQVIVDISFLLGYFFFFPSENSKRYEMVTRKDGSKIVAANSHSDRQHA